jgi:hypothetical protein
MQSCTVGIGWACTSFLNRAQLIDIRVRRASKGKESDRVSFMGHCIKPASQDGVTIKINKNGTIRKKITSR